MSMTIAIDASARVVSIDEVPRGLVCQCRCLECDEPVVARKGQERIHHFSHLSQKIPCMVMPESFLHRYAKQVVQESSGLQLPPESGHHPDSQDKSSWWDFESVKEEVWMGAFRPDLVVELSDGPLLIEFACTSFVHEEKQALIEQLGIRTVEIDLSGLVVLPSVEGLLELKRAILHDTAIKQWLYPRPETDRACDTPAPLVEAETELKQGAQLPERLRFTIQGLWVDLRVLEFGSVVVKSVAYSPIIAELLKRLARQYSGRYIAKYKNWMFPSWAGELVRHELETLVDSVDLSSARASTVLSATYAEGAQLQVETCLDGRVIHQQYLSALAPECMPQGEFNARYFGTNLDYERLEKFFQSSGVEILGIEVVRVQGQMGVAYLSRQERLSHPKGAFDSANRFRLSKKFPCCDDIRLPSRRFPYPEMTHGRSLQHVAHEFEVGQHLTLIRQTANRLKKQGLADAEEFLRSAKVARMMLETELSV